MIALEYDLIASLDWHEGIATTTVFHNPNTVSDRRIAIHQYLDGAAGEMYLSEAWFFSLADFFAKRVVESFNRSESTLEELCLEWNRNQAVIAFMSGSTTWQLAYFPACASRSQAYFQLTSSEVVIVLKRQVCEILPEVARMISLNWNQLLAST